MIDNFNLVSPWFDNLNQGDFYFVQVIQRKKDNNFSKSFKVIKNYTVFTIKQLEDYFNEIKLLCEAFNARAYIWINPRNVQEVQLEIIKQCITSLESKNYNLFKCVNNAIGNKRSNKYDKLFILDLDTKDKSLISKYVNLIPKCTNSNEIQYIPTPNGVHVITKAFNILLFYNKCKENNLDLIDIHKDNPTILYY